MRKLDATIAVDQQPQGCVRLTLKTPSGESFFVDLTAAAAEAHRAAMADTEAAPIKSDPVAVEPAPAAPAKAAVHHLKPRAKK